jgi:hypothetical protein
MTPTFDNHSPTPLHEPIKAGMDSPVKEGSKDPPGSREQVEKLNAIPIPKAISPKFAPNDNFERKRRKRGTRKKPDSPVVSIWCRRGDSNPHGFPHHTTKLPCHATCFLTHATYRFIHACRNFLVSALAISPASSKKPSLTWMNASGWPSVGTSR